MKAKVQVAKKRTNNNVKKAQFMKRARRGMMGFTVIWSDSDPFSENGNIDGGEIDHANPTQKLICRDMWNRCSQWIVSTEFTWHVVMRVCWKDYKNVEAVDCHHVYTCSLRGNKSEILNDAMEKSLKDTIAGNDNYPDGHKNKGVYSHCEFMAVVIGV